MIDYGVFFSGTICSDKAICWRYLAILCSNLPRTVVRLSAAGHGWNFINPHFFHNWLVVSTCFNCDLCFIPTLWQPQIFTFDLCSIHFHTKDFKIFQLWSMVPDFGLKHIETTNWWIQTCFYVQLVGVLDWNRDVRVRKPAPFAKAWAEVFSVWCRNGTSTPLGPICVYKIILVLYYCIIYIHIYI